MTEAQEEAFERQVQTVGVLAIVLQVALWLVFAVQFLILAFGSIEIAEVFYLRLMPILWVCSAACFIAWLVALLIPHPRFLIVAMASASGLRHLLPAICSQAALPFVVATFGLWGLGVAVLCCLFWGVGIIPAYSIIALFKGQWFAAGQLPVIMAFAYLPLIITAWVGKRRDEKRQECLLFEEWKRTREYGNDEDYE